MKYFFEISNSSDFLKFLKSIDIKKPKQNSNPAKPNKKKEVDVNIKSSFIVPTIDVYEYRITHIISEYKIIVMRLLEFSKNIKTDNQKSIVIKFIKLSIKKNKINLN